MCRFKKIQLEFLLLLAASGKSSVKSIDKSNSDKEQIKKDKKRQASINRRECSSQKSHVLEDM